MGGLQVGSILYCLLIYSDTILTSEPFEIAKATKPMATIDDTHKANGIKYGQERRNARAAQKAAAAAATAAAAVDMAID